MEGWSRRRIGKSFGCHGGSSGELRIHGVLEELL